MVERLLKIDEVARMIGYSRQGVYQLVFRKKIPAVKISKRALRFSLSEIERWLEDKSQTEEE